MLHARDSSSTVTVHGFVLAFCFMFCGFESVIHDTALRLHARILRERQTYLITVFKSCSDQGVPP